MSKDKSNDASTTRAEENDTAPEGMSISRRNLLAAAAVGTLASGLSFGYLARADAHDDDDDNGGRDHRDAKYRRDDDKDRRDRRCKGHSTDLGLINGRFLDPASGKVYRDLAIKDGRISSRRA